MRKPLNTERGGTCSVDHPPHAQFVSSVHTQSHDRGLLPLLHGTARCTRTVISAGGEGGNPRGGGHVFRAVHRSMSAILGGTVRTPGLGGLWDHQTGRAGQGCHNWGLRGSKGTHTSIVGGRGLVQLVKRYL